jgi:hypothetical protein
MSVLHMIEIKVFEAKNIIFNKFDECKYLYLIYEGEV